jgi:hypothetical protein
MPNQEAVMAGIQGLTRVRMVAVAALLLFAAGPAQAQTAQLCVAGKLRSSGNVCKGLARCYAVATKKGLSVDDECLGKFPTRLSNLFSELSLLGGCLGTGGPDGVNAVLSSGVTSLADTTLALQPGKCSAKKMAAAGKLCAGVLRCYAAGAVVSTSPSTECLTKQQDKLDKAFTKAVKKGSCNGAADDAKTAVSSLADDVQAAVISTATTTTTPVSGSTTSTTL